MVREAELNAENDRKQQELIELKNQAESLAFQSEKTLKDLGDKVDEATRQNVTEKIEAVRKAVPSNDEAEIRAAHNALETEFHTLSTKLYENVAQEADASEQQTAGAGARAGDDVIDAEFKEEK